MIQIMAGTVGGLGFSFVFGARKEYACMIALNAGLSWGIFLLSDNYFGSFGGNIISAAFCSMFAAICARFMNTPSAVLQMPATVPMIPGGSLYYAMYYAFTGKQDQFVYYAKSTAKAVFAMAIGFALVAVILKKYGSMLTAQIRIVKEMYHEKSKDFGSR